MSRIFITGSSEGLGLMAGQLLVEDGHRVVLHARNAERAHAAHRALPQAEAIIEGDVGSIAGARSVADQANRLGRFDAVIHNVGIGYREPRRNETKDGLPHVFAVNVMAPFVLTALMTRPRRLVNLSSGMHHGVSVNMDEPCGPSAGGTAHRPTPRASSTMCCSLSPSPVAGRMFSPMRWSPVVRNKPI